MAQRIRPTPQASEVHYSEPPIDVSIESPDVQFETLVAIIEADDAANPAAYTNTPPWGEPISYEEYIPESTLQSAYVPPPDMEGQLETELLEVISDAWDQHYPGSVYENSDQYHGLAVPPGVPNYGQPIESGHTQINLPNPSAELGWDAWSGRNVIARVPRWQNPFSGYSAGTNRGHEIPVEKLSARYFTQQHRDLLLAEIQRRGIHNVVVADMPSESYTEQVTQVDPTVYPEMPIGEAGVLP